MWVKEEVVKEHSMGYQINAKQSVSDPTHPATRETGVADIGPCHWVFKKICPDINVRFYLYTGTHPDTPEELTLGEEGNLTGSSFNPAHPTKIIIHGFASDMNLVHLVKIRTGYLSTGPHNIVAVDWSHYSKGPWFCYPVAVANIRHTGQCVAQLIEALRGAGSGDIHLVGFSLGAHVPAFTANYMRPYQIPRITGKKALTLDLMKKIPRFNLLLTNTYTQLRFGPRSPRHRLSCLLREYRLRPCSHRSGYQLSSPGLNISIVPVTRPCVTEPCGFSLSDYLECNHHRAPAYFAESITTRRGFWGWRCDGFFWYLLGMCPPKYPALLMGARTDNSIRGYYIVETSSQSPYALGKWTGPLMSSS
uniref:Lipase domain-containing protein n=1 Tax=Timema poppense TaxID=170557 RepID=A0A7R9D7M2_TIMPO|nr:unnamed protein product [Timema poppensis]